MSFTVYQAPRDFTKELRSELEYFKIPVSRELGFLFLSPAPAKELTWAEWTWENAELSNITSIGSATKLLKSRMRFWQPLSVVEHRRLALIGEGLSLLRSRELIFGQQTEFPEFGAFTLLSKEELLYSQNFSPAVPLGHFNFAQSREAPSRAYLKLWEALTRAGALPKAKERCLDLGASPGAWTWALRRLGCQVTSVDRSELAPDLMQDPQVQFFKGDAFRFGPEQVGELDWLFSDVICYPEKLFAFVQEWLASGKCKNFVCTIKFQGEAEPVWLERFRSLGGKVMHLSHNKHEVTWIKLA